MVAVPRHPGMPAHPQIEPGLYGKFHQPSFSVVPVMILL